MVYVHKKTKARFRLLSTAVDETNCRQGLNVAIYCLEGDQSRLWVREFEEFNMKFTPVENSYKYQHDAIIKKQSNQVSPR